MTAGAGGRKRAAVILSAGLAVENSGRHSARSKTKETN